MSDTMGVGRIYSGLRTHSGVEVTVRYRDGRRTDLRWRLELRSHSPTGLEWGYCGSGPAQLALALAADVMGADLALRVYQTYKRQVIARMCPGGWTLTEEDVRRECVRILEEQSLEICEEG